MEIEDNTYLASIYRMTATYYQMSAKVLHEKFKCENESVVGNWKATPFYYLLSHACELLLKCALLKRGIDENELKIMHLRHNLCNLLAKLEENDIFISEESKKIIDFLNHNHKSHLLRYKALIEGAYTPDPELIFKTLDELLLCTRLNRT